MARIATIDGAGRLVVPKGLRQHLGLERGTKLQIRLEGDRLVLERVEQDCVPIEVEGLLVIRGRLRGEIPDHRELREDRIRSLGGGDT